MGGRFLGANFLQGAEGGVPPKKNSIFFQKIICQPIDRKCQEVSSTSELRFSRDKRLKICRVNMPPPMRYRVKQY